MTRAEVIGCVEAAVRQRGGDPTKRESTFTCPEPAHHENADAHPSARWNSQKKTWHCPVGNIGGGFVDLARRLGIDLDDRRDGVRPPDLAAFAQERHLPVAVLQHFGVRPVDHQGRQALRYPTPVGVNRIKFTDKRKPKYTWATKGGHRHCYGLDRAVECLRAQAAAGVLALVLYLVNGEPSVWACHAQKVAAIAICGGEGTVPSAKLVAELKAKLADAGIVNIAIRVVYDTDKAGRTGAPKVAAALRAGGFADVQALDLAPVLPGVEKGDVDDLHRRVGDRLAMALAALPLLEREPGEGGDAEAEMEEPRSRFRIFDDVQIAALPAPDPLVDGILAMQTFGVLYGAPGTAKTFFALDLALSVASDRPCLGRTVRRGPVVYIAAEGASGLGMRVRAWKQARGVSGLVGVSFVTEAVNLLDKNEVDSLLDALQTLPASPIFLVVDTLARCMVGGDENSAKDMGLAIAALDRVRTTLGCTVLVLHHSAKNVDTERGSSALRGAADTMLALEKDGDVIKLRCDKDKNAAPFDAITMKLVVIELEEMESSCVLKVGAPPVTELSGSRLTTLRTLVDLFGTEGATFTELKNTSIPESSLRRALVDLVKAGYATKPPKSRGGKYTATGAGNAALQRFTAKGGGGDFSQAGQGNSGSSQSPPTDRHGGNHKSQPPPPPPYRGGGEAVSGSGETTAAEADAEVEVFEP